MAGLNFNANNVAPQVGISPLPNGRYRMVLTESEDKVNSKGNGSYLRLKLQVVDGDYKGRTIFVNLNLNNQSAQAVQIAQGELSAICHAVGVLTPTDSRQLHNIPMDVDVVVTKRDNGEMQNSVKGYSKVSYEMPKQEKDPFAK